MSTYLPGERVPTAELPQRPELIVLPDEKLWTMSTPDFTIWSFQTQGSSTRTINADKGAVLIDEGFLRLCLADGYRAQDPKTGQHCEWPIVAEFAQKTAATLAQNFDPNTPRQTFTRELKGLERSLTDSFEAEHGSLGGAVYALAQIDLASGAVTGFNKGDAQIAIEDDASKYGFRLLSEISRAKKNMPARFVGDGKYYNYSPDIHQGNLTSGNVIVLGSDGLWSNYSADRNNDRTAELFLWKLNILRQQQPEQFIEDLIATTHKANNSPRGARDNWSFIAVQYHPSITGNI